MRIIGLTGRAGCGKNTVANAIRLEIGQLPEIAFAAPLKAMLVPIFEALDPNFDAHSMDDRAWKESVIEKVSKSPRQMMQTLGTDWGRQLVHPDVWLTLAGLELDKYRRAGYEVAVVTDCRFENEANWIRGHGGEVWHVLRTQIAAVAEHKSEAGVAIALGLDSVIENSGTIDDLGDQVRRALAGELRTDAPRDAA